MKSWDNHTTGDKFNLSEISIKEGEKVNIRENQNPFTIESKTEDGVNFLDKDKKIFSATFEYLESMGCKKV